MFQELKSKTLLISVLAFLLFSLPACNNKSDTLILSGTVEAVHINVTSEVAGKIVKINKDEGEKAVKDDVLAEIDSSLQELAVKQQEDIVKLKQKKLDDLKSAPTATPAKQKAGAASLPDSVPEQSVQAAETDLEQSKIALEQANIMLSKYKIRASASGTYIERNVNIGDIVNAGGNIGAISDLTDLQVRVYIPQRNKNLVSLNQEINLKSKALSDKNIKGRIIYIADEAEFTPKNVETDEAKENTVFKMKVKILDNIDLLRPGMTVDAYIPLGGK